MTKDHGENKQMEREKGILISKEMNEINSGGEEEKREREG